MGKRNTRNMGREVIQWLKAQYRSGASYVSGAAIRDDITREFGLKLARCTTTMATDWDRQARYELADEHEVVSQPTHKERHLRQPKPTVELRESTQFDRVNELLTRATNQARIARAIAAQPDHQDHEIERATRLDMALDILTKVANAPTPDPGTSHAIGVNGKSNNGLTDDDVKRLSQVVVLRDGIRI